MGWCRHIMLGGLLLGAAASAEGERRNTGKPSAYQEVSDADRAAARQRARNRVGVWHETEPMPEYQFPWLQVGFVGLVFALVTPFAWSAYKQSAKELRATEPTPAPRKRSKPAAHE